MKLLHHACVQRHPCAASFRNEEHAPLRDRHLLSSARCPTTLSTRVRRHCRHVLVTMKSPRAETQLKTSRLCSATLRDTPNPTQCRPRGGSNMMFAFDATARVTAAHRAALRHHRAATHGPAAHHHTSPTPRRTAPHRKLLSSEHLFLFAHVYMLGRVRTTLQEHSFRCVGLVSVTQN